MRRTGKGVERKRAKIEGWKNEWKVKELGSSEERKQRKSFAMAAKKTMEAEGRRVE